MRIEIQTTKQELPIKYLKTLNGTLNLTDKEMELTAAIIHKYLEHKKKGLAEPYLSKFVFSTEERKSLCESLNSLTSQNLGNRLKQLVAKGVLGKNGNDFMFNTNLLPQDSVTFNFILSETTQGTE